MKTPNARLSREDQEAAAAFTRTELLAVMAMLALCSLMLLPALARTKADGRAFQCLNNNRELNRAWRMWTDDNDGKLLASEVSSEGVPAWITAWITNAPNFDVILESITNIMQSPLWPYCGTTTNIWKCPSDKSYVLVNGMPRPRVRSFAMNYYLGPPPNASSLYRSFRKLIEVNDPSPSGLFVFIDLRHGGISYPNFYVDMNGYSPRNPAAYRFLDFPGAQHDGAAVFSYADGHGEIHRWLDPRTTASYSFPYYVERIPSPRNPDIGWLQDRATRPKQ